MPRPGRGLLEAAAGGVRKKTARGKLDGGHDRAVERACRKRDEFCGDRGRAAAVRRLDI